MQPCTDPACPLADEPLWSARRLFFGLGAWLHITAHGDGHNKYGLLWHLRFYRRRHACDAWKRKKKGQHMTDMDIHAAYQADMAAMNREYLALKARAAALEQVVKEYHGWFAHMEETCMEPSDAQFYREQGNKIPAMQARAKALLEQEVK